LAGGEGARVTDEATQRHGEPGGEQAADQQGGAEQQQALPEHGILAALDDWREGARGFGDGDDADDRTVGAARLVHRRRDVHDATGAVIGIVARRAAAVFAAQRAIDVAPVRVVLAHGLVLRVVAHDALRVGDVNAEIERLLLQSPDRRLDRTAAIGLDALRKAAFRQTVGEQIVARQFGEQVGGVDHHILDRVAHAGFDFGDEDAQEEPAGESDDQEIAEEDPRPELHGARL
jgi:hypothetical protein